MVLSTMATGSSTTPLVGAHTTAYFAPGTIASTPSPGPLWEMLEKPELTNQFNEGYIHDRPG